MTQENLTGGQAFAKQLVREGVTHIFGLPGDQIMYALDGLHDEPSIQFITTRHEQGTTYMADGYARAGGQVGVAFVVPGVGVYNAAAGLATAWAASSPVLLLAGQINRHGIGPGKNLGLLHEVQDQIDLISPITAWQKRAMTAEEIAPAIHEAFARLRRGRRQPVEVEAPPEAFMEEGSIELFDRAPDIRVAADPEQITKAADVLFAAERPLAWIGGGVSLADASAELTAVVEFLQAAVVTTREGKGGIDDRNPLSVGTAWVNPRMRSVIDDADVILAVGTHFNASGVPPEKAVIHLDVDPAQVGKHHPSLPVIGDAGPTLAALLVELQSKGDPRPSRAAETRAMRETATKALHAIGPAAGMVEDLRAAIPDDGILVPCTTTMGYMSHMHFPVYNPRSYISTSFMGTLGFGFPAALGAKVACPDKPVVCVTGDGGFLFAATELATAVQYGINTVTVIYNDRAYGNSNRDQRERFKGREYGTELRNPDFAMFAESFGADGVKLKDVSEVGNAVKAAIANDRPTIIDAPMERLPSPF